MISFHRILAWLAGLAVAGSSAMSPASAQVEPPKLRQAGTLVVGTSPTYPPLEFKDPATFRLVGLDIDLSEEIGRRLGLKVEWSEQSFDQLINSLDTGRIDMGASGMTDIASRREKTDFVDYFSTGSQLFTIPAAGQDLRRVEDVCGKPVAVNRNGIFYIRLQDFNRTVCQAKGLPDVKYVLVDRTGDARLQLIQGRCVAVVQGVDAIRFMNESKDSPDRGKYVLIGDPIAVDYAGFGFAKGNAGLRDAVAAAVQAMIADGAYSRIFARWELPYAEIKAVTINTEPRAK